MPVSKKRSRRKPRPPKKRPSKAAEARARETQTAQAVAAKKRQRSLAAIRARKIIGFTLFGLAALVAGAHFMEHMQVINFASQGVEDLVAGYPMAAVLAFVGAVVLGS